MSDDYRTLLVDEFDWAYCGTCKDDVIGKVKAHGFEVEASLYGLLILASRWHPEHELLRMRAAGIVWDSAYYQRLGGASLERLEL
jgi:hypothetical protein